MADTLRIAPWTAHDLRQPVGAWLVREAVAQAQQAGPLDYVCVSLDDSIARKHKHTRHLEPVDWHFDHVESTPYKPRHANGLASLGCNVWVGPWAVTFDVRLYLREKTVRWINRQRRPAERVGFLSKNHLTRHISAFCAWPTNDSALPHTLARCSTVGQPGSAFRYLTAPPRRTA